MRWRRVASHARGRRFETRRAHEGLLPSRDRGTLTRDAIERRLAQHVKTAQQACVSLRSKRITMHTLRQTAAMNLLTAGVDTSTSALWLGHEQERTTHVYLHADLKLKQRTLDRITPPRTGVPAATAPPTPCSPSSRAYSPPAIPLRNRSGRQEIGDAPLG
ncbi:MAG TPA: tyrosine-type recombinase/integrase [Solirubrobacteraceae bacterium]|nr:tyrosine-type recombinase/integrase [Solirubrobacteraceae bacterium]